MGRTGGLAGGGSLFGYPEAAGNRLRILFENRLAKIEFFVVLVGVGNRTDLGALAAARAFCQVYISGRLMYFCGKTSRLAFDAQKLGVREKLNI
jgi:hypothetical protein